MRKITVGFLGCGNIGCGVWKLLHEFEKDLQHRSQVAFEVKKILVRDISKKRDEMIPAHLLTTEPKDVTDDPGIEMIVEFMGGEEPATRYMLRALQMGKTVVTANKMALALNWHLLQEAAQKHNAGLYYEAAVCGAIPIIRTTIDSLQANRIETMMGIINGTTNYILTRMSQEGSAYEDVLRDAQRLGLAEPDPTSDVEGYDAAYKLSILSSLAFHARVPFDVVYRQGISQVDAKDIAFGKELGYTLKLLAIAKREENVIDARVHPTFIPHEHPLSSVNGSFNAVFLHGHACQDMMLFGCGAGSAPTASAVVSDMLYAASRETPRHPTFRNTNALAENLEVTNDWHCSFYVRLSASDRPGVLAHITACLGNEGISIRNLMQRDAVDGHAQIVLITHNAGECAIHKALEAIDPNEAKVESMIRVEGK
ncbi:MAG: homoserine dehydrogenase [Clostridiales bacterium]|nr:homoserine dehydrogenase [Clostridiales bacterium]